MPKRYKSDAFEAVHETMSDLAEVGVLDAKVMRKFDRLCLEERTEPSSLSFHMFKDAEGRWRWRLVDATGKLVASSGHGYKTRKECMSAIAQVRHAGDAKIVA